MEIRSPGIRGRMDSVDRVHQAAYARDDAHPRCIWPEPCSIDPVAQSANYGFVNCFQENHSLSALDRGMLRNSFLVLRMEIKLHATFAVGPVDIDPVDRTSLGCVFRYIGRTTQQGIGPLTGAV